MSLHPLRCSLALGAFVGALSVFAAQEPDPANDPPPDEQTSLRLQLSRDRSCQGTEGPLPCP